MERSNRRPVEFGERPLGGLCVRPGTDRLLEHGAQPIAQLGAGLLGEGDGRDLRQPHPVVQHKGGDPADEGCSLP